MGEWVVDSYHLNIGVGDSAIHILAESEGSGWIAQKIVWIDGGTGSRTAISKFNTSMEDISKLYTNLYTDEPLRFDVIIVTHWDRDHYGGFINFLKLNQSPELVFKYKSASARTKLFHANLDAKLSPYLKDRHLVLNGTTVADVFSGSQVIGTDFFSDVVGIPGKTNAVLIKDLSELLAKHASILTQKKPLMLCLAIEQIVIGPSATGDPADDYAALWKDETTPTNKSSIASIIAWPNGRVSHYFAGDLDWENENKIVKWLSASQQHWKSIPSMKASHHGSCSSTPPNMITKFNPINVIVSAGNMHYHPDWELLLYLCHYSSKNSKRFAERGPLLFMCFPYWLLHQNKKFKESVINLHYFGKGDRKSINKDRLKKIDGLVNIMRKEKVDLFKELGDYTKLTRDVRGSDIFNKLCELVKAVDQTSFGNISTVTKNSSGTNVVQYIRIRSCILEDLDGNAEDKSLNNPQRPLKAIRLRAPAPKQTFSDSRPSNISPKTKMIQKKPVRQLKLRGRYILVFEEDDVADNQMNFSVASRVATGHPELKSTPLPIRPSISQTTRSSGVFSRSEEVVRQNQNGATDIIAQGTFDIEGIKSFSDSNVGDIDGVNEPVEVPSEFPLAEERDYNYTLWVSTTPDAQVRFNAGRRLLDGDPFDDFVMDLIPAALHLTQVPTQEGTLLDLRDSMDQWMKWSIKAKELRVFGTESQVTSLTVTLDHGIIFDTMQAQGALASKKDSTPDVGSLGLLHGVDNSVMVFGLSSNSAIAIGTESKPNVWTLEAICDFFDGLSGEAKTTNAAMMKAHPVLGFLSNAGWVLDTQDLNTKRNAIWYAPFSKYNTTIRLSFDLHTSVGDGPLTFLKSLWPKFVTLELKTVQLIAYYETSISSNISNSPGIVSDFKLTFTSTLKASVEKSPGQIVSVEVDVAVELTAAGKLALTVLSVHKENDFFHFASAIIQKLTNGTDPSSGSLVPAEFQKSDSDSDTVRFRRLQLFVNEEDIEAVTLGIEVTTKLGAKNEQENVAAYLEASYTPGASAGGLALFGELWFPLKDDPDLPERFYSDWESFYRLDPLTPNAASEISLLRLLPDNLDLGGLPDNIPHVVTRAEFNLTTASLSVSATIKNCSSFEPNQTLPSIDFTELSVDASFDWKDRRVFVSLECRQALRGPPSVDVAKPTCTNELIGTFQYESGSGPDTRWEFGASIQELSLGMLYEYFSPDSRNILYDILKDIQIRNLNIDYKVKNQFSARGELVLGEFVGISIMYTRQADGKWSFDAGVGASDKLIADVTISELAKALFGRQSSMVANLPEFLASAKILSKDGSSTLKLSVKQHGTDGVQFKVAVKLGSLKLVFVQLHSAARSSAEDSEDETTANPSLGPTRYFKLTFDGIQVPSDLTLLPDFKTPFDELGFVWLNRPINAEEVSQIESIVNDSSAAGGQVVAKRGAQSDQKNTGLSQGFHFMIVDQGATVLDYPVSKTRSQKPVSSSDTRDALDQVNKGEGNEPGQNTKPPLAAPIDSQSPKAPLKKTQGFLTIDEVQFRYKEGLLSVQMDATFSIGPLTFTLLNFSIGLDFTNGVTIWNVKPDHVHLALSGVDVSFNKAPLQIEGGLFHQKDDLTDIWVGGLTIGFVPWLFQAAGFYGQVTDQAKETSVRGIKQDPFTAAFVYAILRGPLITLEFATISGITAGFGYNVGITIPDIDEIYKFPLLKPSEPGEDGGIVKTIKRLIAPGEDKTSPRWFFPQDGSMWLAAGLTVSAFEMLEVSAVLVAQWSPQIQFHVVGLAVADVPSIHSSAKLAHVELGFIAAIDTVQGLFCVNAQLTPNSYILHPSCHLTGGFALYYWFGNGSAHAGDWVFTIGGYHGAFQIPAHYPQPPRLAINWSVSDSISVRGEAFFAITPKVCMAGLHINATLTAGPLRAWFDASADFLVNYAPFSFIAQGHVSVGVAFSIDKWFVHIHISVEIGATLYIQGPPIAGSVHVDFWIMGFDIPFGESQTLETKALDVSEFYKMAVESGSKTSSTAPYPHIYACLGGLMPNGAVEAQEIWQVRGGPFSFSVNAYFAVKTATVNGQTVSIPSGDDAPHEMYAKPMQLSQPVEQSALTITIELLRGDQKILDPDTAPDPESKQPPPQWRLKPIMKSVPSAIWGQYDEYRDPLAHGNSIDSLLSADQGVVRLVMGVELQAPVADIPEESMQPFEIERALATNVSDKHIGPEGKGLPTDGCPLFPNGGIQSWDWSPLPRKDETDESNWTAVQTAWRDSKERAIGTVSIWTSLLSWKNPPKPDLPSALVEQFDKWYLEAPRLCVVDA